MEALIKENSKMMSTMGKEYFHGPMVINMKENLEATKWMEREFTTIQLVNGLREIGKKMISMEGGSIFGKMEIARKENGEVIKFMVQQFNTTPIGKWKKECTIMG